MPNDFARPNEGFRFQFAGMKTASRADALPLGKYAMAVNVRSYSDGTIQTRPGMAQLFSATAGASLNPITDIRGYALLGNPSSRILAVDTASAVWLDNNATVGSLAGATVGAAMIPFRPGESSEPWMYIANGSDYQKFSSPDAGNNVTQARVGIAEPQQAPSAAPTSVIQGVLTGLTWTNGGTAGATGSTTRVSDTVGTVLPDPVNANLLSAQVAASPYQRWMPIGATGGGGTPGSFGPVLSNTGVDNGGGDAVWNPITNSPLQATTVLETTGFIFASSNYLICTGLTGFIGNVPPGAVITGVQVSLSLAGRNNIVFDNSVRLVKAGSIVGGDKAQGVKGVITYGGQGDTWGLTLTGSDITNPNFGLAFSAGNYDFSGSITVTATVSNIKFTVWWTSGSISGTAVLIRDVFPSLPTALAISGIYYFSGSTGHCIVVPQNMAAGPGTQDSSSFQQNILATLRRGALIQIGAEICIVWSVISGPNNSIAIETSTVNTHTVADTLTAVSTIQTLGNLTGGQAISELGVAYQVTTGVGTVTATVATNPFVSSAVPFQPDDYISFGVLIDNLSNFVEMKIQFDVGDGSFTENYFYYTIRQSDVTAANANAATQLAAAQTMIQRAAIDALSPATQSGFLSSASSQQTVPGNSQWTQIIFPLSALTRVGGDQTKTLQNIGKIQFLWNASGTINVAHDATTMVFGGFGADVGDLGQPYLYRARPRSKAAGIVGNPSPATRYGVNPRREQVTVTLPSAAYNPQIDTWDVFRFGGSVTSWRYIGSTPSNSPTFQDIYFDDAASAGDELEFDNFEPWPSIDTPNNGTATSIVGPIAIVTSTDPDITSYLPGTLVQLGGQNVYTLQNRPTLISGNSYLLQFIENAGVATNLAYNIQEPAIARRFLPYMWGPDANGTVFAVGDLFRPGTLYFSKNYAPDSAPDTYNQEIIQPSEPLLGGETIDGLGYVASPERWWALYPQPDNPTQRYNVVQQPFTRGLAAPYGHCNDGAVLYWWAKDGIYSSDKGSLTGDLYNVFPHEGIVGENITYNGVTVYAPDYTRVNTFRLTYSLGYLYAVYQDTTGTYRVLTLDVRRGAWCVDQFTPGASTFYHIEQQAQANSAVTLIGTWTGNAAIVAKMQALTNDLVTPITTVLATNEFNGGEDRAPKQWGDFFVDSLPAAPAGIVAQPMSLGAGAAMPTTILSSATRTRTPASVGGKVVSDFLGLALTWTDDYTQQTTQTRIFIWQPSFVVQPAKAVSWQTFGTSFGLDGYMHIRQLSIAYVSQAPITVTVTSYDGQTPAAITLPSTGGVYQKTYFPLPANKGQLFKINMTSAQPFQIFSEDSELYIGQWGRTGPYMTPSKFGGSFVQPSPI